MFSFIVMIKLNRVSPNSSNKEITLIFIHGNSQNAQVWEYQLNSEKLQQYNLIAFELPGHGLSPKMKEYSIKNIVDVLAKHVDQEKNYILVGHSLGGHFCIEALPELKNCIGLLLCGTPPLKNPLNLDEAFNQDERMGLLFKENLTSEEFQLLASFITSNKDLTVTKSAIRQSDAKFRGDMGLAVTNGELLDEVSILQKTELPIAIVQGESDDLVSKSYLESVELNTLWENQVNYVSKSAHSPHFENPKEFNDIVLEFVNSIPYA